MADEKQLKQAKLVYETLCQCLDSMGWTYDRNDGELTVYTGAAGRDIPIELNLRVDPIRHLVTVLSKIPVEQNNATAVDLSVTVSAINNHLVDGSFDYNMTDVLVFRLTSSYLDSLLSEDLFQYMICIACRTVDDYNKILSLVSKGEMTFEDVIKKIYGDTNNE